MAVSTYVKVKRDGVLTLLNEDGDTYTVAYENGDLKFDNATNVDDEIVIRDRGNIVGVRAGDSQVITGSFSVHFREFTNVAAVLLDVIAGTGAWSSNPKANANFEQYNLNIKLEIDKGTDSGTTAPTAVLNTCVIKASFSEGDPDNIQLTFNCYEGITYSGNT